MPEQEGQLSTVDAGIGVAAGLALSLVLVVANWLGRRHGRKQDWTPARKTRKLKVHFKL